MEKVIEIDTGRLPFARADTKGLIIINFTNVCSASLQEESDGSLQLNVEFSSRCSVTFRAETEKEKSYAREIFDAMSRPIKDQVY